MIILSYFNAKVDSCMENVTATQMEQVVGLSCLCLCVFNVLSWILSWSNKEVVDSWSALGFKPPKILTFCCVTSST